MSLLEAVERYHALLTEDLAADSQAQLTSQLKQRNLYFGSRPLCSVLRPRFLSPQQVDYLQRQSAVLMSAFAKTEQRALHDPAFRAQYRLLEWEEALLQDDPGFAATRPVSRLDAFFVTERGGIRLTEYNAETPAAAAYNDVLAEVFFGLPVMREFLRHFVVRPQPARHHVMHALLGTYQAWLGRRERPRIAIVDWREVPTYSEFVITAEYLQSQGLECVITDPREVEYRQGKLYAGEMPIDLVYKRVLISELIARGGLHHPLVRAVRDGAVCMVNPFRCKVLHKKASLAVLSDERNRELFGRDELQTIAYSIPWTRVVEERHTEHDGKEVDLIPFILQARERMVLKPNDEYGGAGIILGWEVDDATWHRCVQQALDEPFVVQERIDLPREVYPSLVDGRLEFAERIVDTAPFIFYGQYMEGCLTRLSTESLVNVTAGGGSSLATFVVEKR